MKNLGIPLLFTLSLVALYLTLTWREPVAVLVEPSASPPDRAVTSRLGPSSTEATDAGLRLEERMQPLKGLDTGKLSRECRLGGTARR